MLYSYHCTDVNECQTDNGGCNQTCSNVVGSYDCFCGVGYSLAVDNLNCDGKKLLNNYYNCMASIYFSDGYNVIVIIITDVDECQTSNGGCNQTCTNMFGSFECSCDLGYSLALDGLDCDGMQY